MSPHFLELKIGGNCLEMFSIVFFYDAKTSKESNYMVYLASFVAIPKILKIFFHVHKKTRRTRPKFECSRFRKVLLMFFSAPEKQFILKSIFTEAESEKTDEFHVSQKSLSQRSSKILFKKISCLFYVFQI